MNALDHFADLVDPRIHRNKHFLFHPLGTYSCVKPHCTRVPAWGNHAGWGKAMEIEGVSKPGCMVRKAQAAFRMTWGVYLDRPCGYVLSFC